EEPESRRYLHRAAQGAVGREDIPDGWMRRAPGPIVGAGVEPLPPDVAVCGRDDPVVLGDAVRETRGRKLLPSLGAVSAILDDRLPRRFDLVGSRGARGGTSANEHGQRTVVVVHAELVPRGPAVHESLRKGSDGDTRTEQDGEGSTTHQHRRPPVDEP